MKDHRQCIDEFTDEELEAMKDEEFASLVGIVDPEPEGGFGVSIGVDTWFTCASTYEAQMMALQAMMNNKLTRMLKK